MTNKVAEENGKLRIYLAGPLFNLAEREFNRNLAALLRRKYEVWLPQEQEQRHKPAREVFAKDREGITWADLMVASMDGSDPDSGTSWECGYAFGLGIPIVVFRTDFRMGEEPGKGSYNLMLTQSATEQINAPYLKGIEDLAEQICDKIDRLERLGKLKRSLRAAR